MASSTIIALIGALSAVERPVDFINRDHCEECEEHYLELIDVSAENCTYQVVENPGWDPTCFLTPKGFRYYLPALIRISDETPTWITYLIIRVTGFQRDGLSSADIEIVDRVFRHWLEAEHVPTEIKSELRTYLAMDLD